MPRGPKRSALEVNKEKLAAVEEKLAKLEETVKALKAEKKELAAEIRKAELSELLDAIEESNLSVNDVHEFIKQILSRNKLKAINHCIQRMKRELEIRDSLVSGSFFIL